MPSAPYVILWVVPESGVENIPTLEQLDDVLKKVHACVMYRTFRAAKRSRQTAIQLFEAADEATVRAKLTFHYYKVVEKQFRPRYPALRVAK